MVNHGERWSSFPETLLISTLFGVIFFVGLLGNGVVVFVVARSWASCTVTLLYFLNLAVADLLLLVFCASVTASVYLLPSWPFGSVLCKLTNYLMMMSAAVSVLTLMAMGHDRYQAVVSPVQSRAHRTVKKVLTVLALIWFLSLTTTLPMLFVSELRRFYDLGGTSQDFCVNFFSRALYKQLFTLGVFVAYYCVPLLFIAGCYFLMAWRLRARVARGNRRPSAPVKAYATARLHSQSRRRLSKLVLAVVAAFTVCWLPIHCVHLKIDFSQPTFSLTLYVLKIVAQFLSYANSAINPCQYAFMSGSFRECLRGAFRCGEHSDEEARRRVPRRHRGAHAPPSTTGKSAGTKKKSSVSLHPCVLALPSGDKSSSGAQVTTSTGTDGSESPCGSKALRQSPSLVEMESIVTASAASASRDAASSAAGDVTPMESSHGEIQSEEFLLTSGPRSELELSATAITKVTIHIKPAESCV